MKKRSIMVLVAAAMLAASVPALAIEHKSGHDANCQRECELLMRNCSLEVDTLQQKIQKLQFAIQNNADKYTPQELNALKEDLEDTRATLVNLERGGA